MTACQPYYDPIMKRKLHDSLWKNLITTSLTKKPGGKHCRSYTHERLNKIVNEAALDKKKFIQHISLLCRPIYGLKSFKISKVFEVFANGSS